MSTDLAIVDRDTRLGALKAETHWALVLAATGGGLTFTWLGHLMAWTPLGFAVHGVTGAAGGYLVGTAIARMVTGVRVRPVQRRYEMVSMSRRVVSSALRMVAATALFAVSYFFAVGMDLSVAAAAFDPNMIGMLVPIATWVIVLGAMFVPRLFRAMR